MDQKEFEQRLDGYADKMAGTVTDGIKKMEDAFDKGKHNIQEDLSTEGERRRMSGSPRFGVILVACGMVWLLYTLDLFSYTALPILLVVAGLYLILRKR
jgi:hypothetical protein